MRAGLFSEVKNNPWALAFVISIHIVLIVLLSINLSDDKKPPMPMAQKHNIIDAVAVDAKQYDDREKQKKLDVEKQVLEKKRQQEAERDQALEKKRLAEQKDAEVKRQQELAQKKSQEKEKQLSLAKKKEQEQIEKEKQAAEKQAAAKRAEEKKALEKKEAARKEQERLEAEKKRLAEEERQRRETEKAEFERAVFEEERRVEEARKQAEHTARLQTQRSQYVATIAQKVNNNWLRPAGNVDGLSCDVIVTQTMSGDVIDVRLQECANDVAFQRSVERAVRKASPLPLPPDPEVFDREIFFTFKPL
jgi:colicin import membrane protein